MDNATKQAGDSNWMRARGWAKQAPLKGACKAVLLALADHVNKHNSDVWPGEKRLALEAGISACHVSRMVNRLRKLGYLSIKKEKMTSGLIRNRYTLKIGFVNSTVISPAAITPVAITHGDGDQEYIPLPGSPEGKQSAEEIEKFLAAHKMKNDTGVLSGDDSPLPPLDIKDYEDDE
jgi:hypothetical protein